MIELLKCHYNIEEYMKNDPAAAQLLQSITF